MNLILDTSVVVWLGAGSARLSRKAGAMIAKAPEVYVSPLAIVELSIRSRKGKLAFDAPASLFVRRVMEAYDLKSCPFDESTANLMDVIPMHHEDPFDRMLVCHAISLNLAIVTPDVEIAKYPVQVIW